MCDFFSSVCHEKICEFCKWKTELKFINIGDDINCNQCGVAYSLTSENTHICLGRTREGKLRHGSKAEVKFFNELSKKGIPFIREYSFPKNKKRYDAYLPTINVCIEIDGIQHKTSSYIGPSRNEVANDKLKRDMANEKGIHLIRIEGDYINSKNDFHLCFEEVENELRKVNDKKSVSYICSDKDFYENHIKADKKSCCVIL